MDDADSAPSLPARRELTAIADRNLALSTELTFGSSVSSCGVETILPELVEPVSGQRVNARQVQANCRNCTLEGKI
jgi:hypothetical protein